MSLIKTVLSTIATVSILGAGVVTYRIAVVEGIEDGVKQLCYREAIVATMILKKDNFENAYYEACRSELKVDRDYTMLDFNIWTFDDAAPDAHKHFYTLRKPEDASEMIQEYLDRAPNSMENNKPSKKR